MINTCSFRKSASTSNKYFYKFAGVKFKNINKCWIVIFNHMDNYDPSLIHIGENVMYSK